MILTINLFLTKIKKKQLVETLYKMLKKYQKFYRYIFKKKIKIEFVVESFVRKKLKSVSLSQYDVVFKAFLLDVHKIISVHNI